ncbi:MAG: hypothetical protein LC800_17775 [Acidobacteria bacterium]|nr:hypothetical protein [Acidobacteriota bacterium]
MWKPSSSCHVCARESGASPVTVTTAPRASARVETPVTLTPDSFALCARGAKGVSIAMHRASAETAAAARARLETFAV